MNREILNKLKKEEYDTVSRDLKVELRKEGCLERVQNTAIAVAYVLYKIKDGASFTEYRDFIQSIDVSGKVVEILNRYVPDFWNIVISKVNDYSKEQLLACILFDNTLDGGKKSGDSTPDGIAKLACDLLEIEDSDEILELCSGRGNFAVELSIHSKKIKYTGVELFGENYDVATLRMSLIQMDTENIQEDAFKYRSQNPVDKLFSNYPFMLRDYSMKEYKEDIRQMMGMEEEIIEKASSDWVFNTLLVMQMKENGKAVAVMTNGSTWNSADKNIRKYFVENGYIEAVISLPEKLFDDTAIATTMIVFSKNNEKVKLVDARKLCEQERKNNILTDCNIEEIIQLLHKETELSICRSPEDLKQNEYILNAERYFENSPKIKNGVEFGSVIKKITRGAQLKAKELDELKSSEITLYQYLMLANINDGVISFEEDGQYLSEMPKKLEKYCVKNNSIVLAKIGMPKFKSAVVTVEESRKILANGNLFVIEIDEKKANPFFLQAVFSSEFGEAILKSIYTGAVMPTISMEKLKKMMIPLPTLKEQNEIAEQYQAIIREISGLRKKLIEETDKIKNIYKEV